MTTIANLRVNFVGDTSSFDQATGRVRGGMNKMATAAAGLISGAALGGVLRNAIEAGSAIHDMGQRTGLSAEFLSAMELAADQMGASLGTATSASLKLGKSAEMAAQGNKKLSLMFSQLGINAEQFVGLSADEKFRQFAEAVSKVTDESVRNYLVSKLAGPQALKLNEIWKGGAAALDEMNKSAKEANRLMSQDQANAADDAGDAIGQLTAAWHGLQTQFGLGLAPTVTKDIKALTSVLGDLVHGAEMAFSFLHGVGNVAGAVAAAVSAAAGGNFAGALDIIGFGQMPGKVADDLLRDPTKDGERAAEQRRTNELLTQQIGLNKEMVGVLIKNGRVVAQ